MIARLENDGGDHRSAVWWRLKRNGEKREAKGFGKVACDAGDAGDDLVPLKATENEMTVRSPFNQIGCLRSAAQMNGLLCVSRKNKMNS